MALYVVTGGAGFVGSAIVRRLAADGHYVRVVDDFSTGRRDNLAVPADQLTVLEGSVCDLGLLQRAFKDAEAVFHQAAIASVQASVDDPLKTDRVNVGGTLNVLVAARECNVPRVVYASSCGVYGDASDRPQREGMAPAPRSPYAVSKLAGELYCVAFHRAYGLPTVALRYFNVYGPGQDPHGPYAAAIPAFVDALSYGERPRVFGDGEQTRDFVFVEDVVEANMLAAASPDAVGQVFNVGSGQSCSVNQLLRVLCDLMGVTAEPEYCPARPGDVRHSEPDVTRAGEVLQFAAKVPLAEGLRRTLKWYKDKEQSTFFVPPTEAP